jgi:hypothetical protein
MKAICVAAASRQAPKPRSGARLRAGLDGEAACQATIIPVVSVRPYQIAVGLPRRRFILDHWWGVLPHPFADGASSPDRGFSTDAGDGASLAEASASPRYSGEPADTASCGIACLKPTGRRSLYP